MPDIVNEIDLPPDRPKIRKCLSCSVDFESAWAGERICRRCKNSKGWRDGYSMRSVRPDGRVAPKNSSN